MKKTIYGIGPAALFCVLLCSFFSCTGLEDDRVPQHQANEGGQDTRLAFSDQKPGSQKVTPSTSLKGPENLSSKTEVVSIGSSSVAWPEFYFWLKFIEKHYRSVHRIDAITDWSVPQNGVPLKDFFLSSAVGYACKERALEAKSLELGVDLSSEDWQQIERKREQNIKIYGRTEYLRMIRRMYVSEEVFAYLTRMDRLGRRLFAHLYGENGETCPEKDGSDCQRLFRSQVEGWCADMDIDYKAAYHRIDPESLFK
jgi:hypothetical protein